MIFTLIKYEPKDKDYGRTEHDCPSCHTNIAPVFRKKYYLCTECLHKGQITEWYD